ncbi:MAG: hypothetical protein AMXMBFR46_06160 [Acidimicrobiia bacterium]
MSGARSDDGHDGVRGGSSGDARDDARRALDAWRDLCRRLERMGERVLSDDFPPHERVALLEHLAGQAMCWTGWSVFHADARRPVFQRQNDLVTPWGGPNADNVYRHARVDPGRSYRIRGRMHSCEDFLLTVRAGFMHEPRWGTLHEVSASDLGIRQGDTFELLVGGEPTMGPPADGSSPPPRWVPLPDGAAMVSFREYYLDWVVDEPATITIECCDEDGDPAGPALDASTLASRFAAAAAGVEHSIEHWNRYLHDHRDRGTDNAFGAAMQIPKGLDAARYAFCFWDLADDEALLVECDEPRARYWSFQCYELGTYELIDPADRQSGLNHRQAVTDPDGTVRLVLAHRDPGVANWLDTGGRPHGLLTLRWFWPEADPHPVTRRVPLHDLARTLPSDTVWIDPAARAEVLRVRRAHLSLRFRT